jgi:hypothetical protein
MPSAGLRSAGIEEGSASAAKEVGYHRLVQRYSGGPAFYPINTPPNEMNKSTTGFNPR